MARRAEYEVTLVAPFVKVAALRKIVEEVREQVRIHLYTRWRPDEIAAGVSDVEAWQVICERQLSSMYLCHHLHAKCYVFDSEACVGSANITSRALGWHSAPNLEIQVTVPASSERVVGLLQDLQSNATPVSDEIAARFEALALDLKKLDPKRTYKLLSEEITVQSWLPNTRQPSDLYFAYDGRNYEISRGGQKTTCADLDYLGIPPGLSQRVFESSVAAVIAQHDFFVAIHEMSAAPRRFGEYRHFVRQYLSRRGSDRDAADTWQTCLRWLMYFCADRYEVVTPHYLEILRRRQ